MITKIAMIIYISYLVIELIDSCLKISTHIRDNKIITKIIFAIYDIKKWHYMLGLISAIIIFISFAIK